ncbi:MAG: GGDEF domain-containing protein [Lachnospiraceae bacterium]|nr:GGDEF domain-containing protein [Lachnospiraceae bacterium]
MGYGFNRQEERRVAGRLACLNASRTLLTALAGLPVVLVLALIYNIPGITKGVTNLTNIALLAMFAVNVAGVVLEKRALDQHKVRNMSLITKVYWAFFEAFMLLIIYADAQAGGHMGLYPILVAAINFIPVFASNERIYYQVLHILFAVFANVLFDATAGDYAYLVLLNALFIMGGIRQSKKVVTALVASERAKDAKDLEAIDKLTGLLNKKGFEKRTEIAAEICTRNRKRMSIVLFDIDDLQQYNNSYGSDRGNFLIKQIAQIIQNGCKRDSDIVCRQNGGRFIVYIDGRDENYVSELGDRIRASVEGKRIPHGRRASYQYVTLSVGIACDVPVEEDDIYRFCDEAEDYLYGAKENGKNCTVCNELIYGAYSRRAN